MNPVDIKISTYINFDKNNNKEDSRFRVGDNVRISTFFLQKITYQIGLKKFL